MELIQPAPAQWSASKKFWFRFFCSLFVLYTFPFPFNNIPFGTAINSISEKILGWYIAALDYTTVFWHWLIPGVGKYLLHLKTPITIFTNGSGDTTFDYVLLLTQVLLSVLIGIAWSLLDRKRPNYTVAYYWLCVLVRYFLGGMMLSYGFTKVFHLQMTFPYLSRLLQPYGDSSPMGLAWTYVGQSKPFSQFVGWSEVLCGILLVFRKTTLIGALLSLVVMGNIVVINMCYDVPVKLFSSTLEVMALYLAAPYGWKLYKLFVKHESAVLEKQEQPKFRRKWMQITVRILKVLIIADALYYGVASNLDGLKQYGEDMPKPPLYGIYNSVTVIRNNDTIAPLTTDTTRWKQLVIQTKNFAKIKMMNDTMVNFNFKVDTVTHMAIVFKGTDSLNKAHFKYAVDSMYLTLKGSVKNDSVYMRFKRYDEKQFRLMNRGFHWINEFPYNR